MHVSLQISKHLQTPCILVGTFSSVTALALTINLEDLSVKQASEQSGRVPKLLWLARLDSG